MSRGGYIPAAVGLFTALVILVVVISLMASYSVKDAYQPSLATALEKGYVPAVVLSFYTTPAQRQSLNASANEIDDTTPVPIPVPVPETIPNATDGGATWDIVTNLFASLPNNTQAQAAGCYQNDLFPAPDVLYPNVVASPRLAIHPETGTLVVAYLDGLWAKGGALRLMTLLPVTGNELERLPTPLPITRCAGNNAWDRVKDPHLVAAPDGRFVLIAQVEAAEDVLEGLPARSAIVTFHSEDRGHSWSLRRTWLVPFGSRIIDFALAPSSHLTLLLFNGSTTRNVFVTSNDNGATWRRPIPLDVVDGKEPVTVAYSAKIQESELIAFAGARHTGLPADGQFAHLQVASGYGQAFGRARRILPMRAAARDSVNLLHLGGQINGYLARGVTGAAATRVNASSFSPKRQLILRVAPEGRLYALSTELGASPRAERLALRSCEGGSQVRSGCVSNELQERCVPSALALASSCVRVHAPQIRAVFAVSDNDGVSFEGVQNADPRIPLDSEVMQDIPLDIALLNGKNRLGLLLESVSGDGTVVGLELAVHSMQLDAKPEAITLVNYDARATGRSANGQLMGADARLIAASHGFYIVAAIPGANATAAMELPGEEITEQRIDAYANTHIALYSVSIKN